MNMERDIVLIVDDTPANLGVLFDTLETSGFRVLVNTNGESALETIKQAHPDIVLLDIMMPGMDGFETCRHLKSDDAVKDIPVIFMTALTDAVDEIRGLEMGAVDYITKPIRVETVLARVKTHLSLQRLQKELKEKNIRLEQEIAERINLESQLRMAHKMKAIGTMTGGIAHEFNNILGIILGNADIAADDIPDWNPARFNLEEIRTACFRAKNVIRQLMYLCQKTELLPKPLNILPLVKSSLEMIRAIVPNSVEIRSNLPEALDPVQGDPAQLHQVMLNLYNNAVQAMSEKGGILEVNLENIRTGETPLLYTDARPPDPGNYVRLSVCDTGHGIDPEIRERIFEPYFTTRGIGEGTGLGLAIVYGIVKNHGGSITVSSEPDRGSQFHLFFPVIAPAETEKNRGRTDLPSAADESCSPSRL
ncbi:MAG: sensor histidine kinase [Desulfococcaceae bacterium]